MQFDKLVIEKFMSFDSQTIEFGRCGLTLIEGPNGAGKSSIFDAISWALFGQTVRGLKGNEIINRKFKKNCRVRLRFSAKGESYSVERFRAHKEYGDRFYYTKGKETVELGTLPMTQERLLQDLGIDFELFRCTVLFAQEETFNFVNATNKEQKEILSKVMKLDYSEFLSSAKTAAATLEEEAEVSTSKLEVLSSHVDESPELIYADEIERFEAERAKQIAHHEGLIAGFEAKIAKAGPRPEGSKKLRELRYKVQEAQKKADEDLHHWQQIAGDMRADARHAEHQLSDLGSGTCPTCKQEIKKSKVNIKELELEKAKADDAYISASAEVEKRRMKSIDLTEKERKLREMIFQEEQKDESYRNAEGGKKDHERSLAYHKSQENEWLKKRDEHIEKQKKIAIKVAELEKRLGEIEEELPYRQFWVNAFGDSGIKSFVFDLICSTLTNKTNKYLSTLTDGMVTVSFDTQKKLKSGESREKFDCMIVTDGERVPYQAYSGGEKRRISLAVDMALSELMSDYYGSKFSMVIFDEQTSYMEKSGRQGFLTMLEEIAKEKQVFVVDHDAEFKSQFDNVMTIEKVGGISRIA